jgi:metallo-beta-lactamase class B
LRKFSNFSVFICLLLSLQSVAQSAAFDTSSWTKGFPPFRIAGNLYYVGSEDLAAYLIVTSKGNILINSNLASSPTQIKKSVETLGFRFSDTKILLISHGHFDHCAGSAEVKRLTGARYYVMDRDVSVVESGGASDFHYAKDETMHFTPTHVDRALRDGEKIELGGATLTARLTAGHTKGTTTWTLDEAENRRTLHVVIVGSPNVNPGYELVGNKTYPQIAGDYRRGFETLRNLQCDIFLGAHGGYFGLQEKYARLQKGDRDAFIDPAGYRAYIADRERAFETELQRQQSAPHR